MKFDLKKPCDNCPFLREPYFHLGPDRREELADSLRRGMSFSCHKTVNYDDDEFAELDDDDDDDDDDDVHIPSQDEQHCAGALLTMMRCSRSTNMMHIAHRIGLFDADGLYEGNMETDVYESLEEFEDDR